jgi:anaerobic selenocysteine-containing dehydrogenase
MSEPGRFEDVVGACALDCPDGCSWVVTVDRTLDPERGGRAVRLRGNAEHPFTRGGLCAKVNPYLEYASAPGRLLHPLRRTGPKGSGEFERIGWDDALTEIAGQLRAAVDEHGGESIWPYAGTGTLGFLQGCDADGARLFHALGASRHYADICSKAGTAGMSYTTGSPWGMDPEDLAHSRLIILWGTNTLTTNLHLWPFVTAGRERGAELVVVDPVRTRTADRADRHIAPRPGTDAALALGLMAELVRIGAADEEYLAAHALGWEAFRDEVLTEWSVARAADVCGLDPEDVAWLAGRIAASRPTGIRCLMGMQRHGGGGAALRALSCLPAVTGDYGRHGGGLCYSTGRAYPIDTAAISRPDLQPAGPTRHLAMARLGRELLERTDPPVRALVMWAANPMVSNPDTGLTRAGLSRDDLFTVVVDHVLTDTARYADVVLPGTTQLEHNDLHNSYSHLYLNWNAPAVAPPGECLSHTEIFRRLASALGLTEPALFASDDELAEAGLSTAHPAMDGVTLAALKKQGWVRMSWPTPALPFAEGFPTASGRFEFSSERGAADGAGRFPGYTPAHVVGRPAPEPSRPGAADPAAGHPAAVDSELELISAANHYLVNSTFGTGPRAARAGAPRVTLHPDDAAVRGIADGDEVELANLVGAFTATAVVSDAVRRGVAATTKGIWPGAGTAGVNAVTADRVTDLGAGATFHDTRVTVRPLGATVASGSASGADGQVAPIG